MSEAAAAAAAAQQHSRAGAAILRQSDVISFRDAARWKHHVIPLAMQSASRPLTLSFTRS